LDRQEYWEEIRKYPHICASHTLVLGLCRFYGRQNFSFICSADDLLEAFYHNWSGSVRNDIIRQISLSEIISQFDPNIANIFRKNKYQLFRSLKFLIELDIEPSYLELDGLSPAERNFLELYKIIRQKPIWQIDEVDENQFDSKLKDALLEIFFTEVDNNCLQNQNNINYKNIIKNKDLEELKNLLNSFLAGEDDDQFIDLSLGLTEEARQEGGIGSYLDALESVQILLENRITKIVFHGIHHLQPLMMRFLDELQRKGIEVIFLIPYSKKYSQIYKTWKRVYSWTNINFNDFEDTEEVKLNEFSAALVNLFKSGAIGYTSKKIKRFSDITHLTNYIGFIYEKAKRRATEKNQSALANMEEQFYAVKASDLNDMLKNYYPEQFGQRHFLAYPVGQFILAIYNM
jgi:hypothetical protein